MNWPKKIIIGLAAAAIVVLPRIIDLDVFYARDELTIWTWTNQFALAVWQGDLTGTMTASDYPGIPLFWVETLFLTLKRAVLGGAVPLDRLTADPGLARLAQYRLVGGLFGAGQILAAAWLIRRLFGWRVAGLAVILMGLSPFGLTEARVLRLEMISAGFVCLSVLAYLLYLRERHWGWVLLSGVMAGLGVSAKTSAGLVVPYIWLLLGLDFWLRADQAWPQRVRQLLGNGLIWAGGAIAIFWLIWPAMWVAPVEAIEYVFLRGFSQAADRSVWGDEVFFWGRIWPGDPGPFFYPVVYAFRVTPVTWLGFLAAVAAIFYRRIRLDPPAASFDWPINWPGASLWLLLAYVVLLTVELSLVVSKVDRFLLLVFPLLHLLSAIGLAGLAGRRWLWPVMGLVLLIQGGQAAWAHPYYYTYWNPLVGGGRAAMETLPLGSGEGIDRAMNYLNRQPEADQSRLVCGASRPWCEHQFTGETLRFASYVSGEWAGADYASFYISQLQRQQYPTEIVDFFMARPTRYRVDLQGATYVWLYDVPQMDHFAGAWNELAGVGQLLGYSLSPAIPGGAGGQAGETVEALIWWINRGGGLDNLVLRWLDETGYEWGRVRVEPLPEYAALPPPQRAVVAGRAELLIPPDAPPGLYFLRLGVAAPDEARLVGEFDLPETGNRLVVEPGRILTDTTRLDIPGPVDQTLAPAVDLLGYGLPNPVLTPESSTWLALYWQATGSPPDHTVMIRLLDSRGREAVRWQGRPAYPTDQWQPGQIVRDVRPLPVGPEIPMGRYRLEISLDGSEAAYTIPDVEVRPRPIMYDIPEMQAELQANFGPLILLGYNLYFDAADSSLEPVFYWQSRTDVRGAFAVRLTLRAAPSERVIHQWRLPLADKQSWQAGEVVNTSYHLPVDSLGESRYHLDLSLHEAATGAEPGSIRIEDIQDKVIVRVTQ